MAPLQALARFLLSAGLALNGAAMLLVPHAWFHAIPGVVLTGPENLHLVRDVGAAYLVAAGGLAWPRASAAHAAAAFLLLHAAVHLGETLAGTCGLSRFLADVPGVVGPALLALFFVPPRRSRP